MYISDTYIRLNYDRFIMSEHRPELVLIAAYDLCHPSWSKGLIKQTIWRDHQIKVIQMGFECVFNHDEMRSALSRSKIIEKRANFYGCKFLKSGDGKENFQMFFLKRWSNVN